MRREFGCGMREGRVLERSRPSHLSPLTRHSPSAPQSAFLFRIPHRVESPHSLLLPDPAFLFCTLHWVESPHSLLASRLNAHRPTPEHPASPPHPARYRPCRPDRIPLRPLIRRQDRVRFLGGRI